MYPYETPSNIPYGGLTSKKSPRHASQKRTNLLQGRHENTGGSLGFIQEHAIPQKDFHQKTDEL